MSLNPDCKRDDIGSQLAARDHAAWAAGQAARRSGAVWSALTPEPRRRRNADELTAAAEAELSARQAWRDSPAGRLKAALSVLQQTARTLDQRAEALREAASRDPDVAADLWPQRREDLRRDTARLRHALHQVLRALP
ncbi:hypothetical protein [Phenylobacterium sp.]|uniref:hypothetical protein n=1 Tax=Phenylobacterium sp. TaxID=1871053 RepID=UPI0019A9F692|nr:hypothetical protein [Phenylobacterium sp.]MBC7166766.1 hypothetical protein [Phenylobacterium sp.]